MLSYGIVSEFNPFHNGHAYLFKSARERGAEAIVCVMSGNSVQRGELAITDKYARAKAALECGADLVLELPFPWSSGSAEYFAEAAVYIASFFSDTLFFGSERGNKEELLEAARLCESEVFSLEYKERLSVGEGAATAFLGLLEQNGFSALGSNDLLGVAYIRAILRNRYEMKFDTVERLGAAYNSTDVQENELPSASAVRKMIFDGNLSTADSLLPSASAEILRKSVSEGAIADNKRFLDCALMSFRLCNGADFSNIAEAGGGLSGRICSAAREATGGEELIELVKTKAYTNARIKRAMLYCMTGVMDSDIRQKPQYTTLLAANSRGRELLSKNRKRGGIEVVTKPADAPICRQRELSEKLDAVFTLALENKKGAGEFLKKGAYIT